MEQILLTAGLFSMVFAAIGVIANDWVAVMDKGFFQGYTWLVAVVILLQVCSRDYLYLLLHCLLITQAIGGLIVAVVIKYAGNILKGFAAAVSIVISSVVSYFFLQFQPSP